MSIRCSSVAFSFLAETDVEACFVDGVAVALTEVSALTSDLSDPGKPAVSLKSCSVMSSTDSLLTLLLVPYDFRHIARKLT